MSQGSLVLQSLLEVNQLFKIREFRERSHNFQDLEDEIREDLNVLEGLLGC